MKRKKQVIVVMGSQSDLKVMMAAVSVLESFGIFVGTEIVSAHRTPGWLEQKVHSWEADGIMVIIAGAGGAAHLPGMLAAFSVLPVIGVPVVATKLGGLDALLSIVQMPAGVPVAGVAIDNSTNAGLLAAQILAQSNPALRVKLKRYKKDLTAKVRTSSQRLAKLGPRKMLGFLKK